MAQISDTYKTGTSWSLHGSSPNYCDTKTHHKTRRHLSRDQNQTSTQSETARQLVPKISNIQSQILGLNHMAYHNPEDNICHYMAFRLKIFQVGKFPTSESLTKLQDIGTPRVTCDAWINFSSRTVKLRPSESRENLSFLFSPFLPLCSFPPFSFFLFLFPFFFLFFWSYPLLNFFFFWSYPHQFLFLFALSLSIISFFLTFFFFFFLFSYFDFLSFLLFLSPLSFLFFFLFQPPPPPPPPPPPTFLPCHLSHSHFFFLIFVSFFILHLTVCSM